MPKKSFRDAVTNVLKTSGYVTTNQPGDLVRDEPDDFNLEPGLVQWNGTAWVAVPQATLDTQKTQQTRTAATNLLNAFSNSQATLLRAFAAVLADEINICRAAIPRGILSITRATTIATAITRDPHGLTTGATIRVQGTTLAAYNVTAVATVVNATTFTYPVAGNPATPAVGPAISYTLGVVPPMNPRTLDQARTAILANIAAGLVDT